MSLPCSAYRSPVVTTAPIARSRFELESLAHEAKMLPDCTTLQTFNSPNMMRVSFISYVFTSPNSKSIPKPFYCIEFVSKFFIAKPSMDFSLASLAHRYLARFLERDYSLDYIDYFYSRLQMMFCHLFYISIAYWTHHIYHMLPLGIEPRYADFFKAEIAATWESAMLCLLHHGSSEDGRIWTLNHRSLQDIQPVVRLRLWAEHPKTPTWDAISILSGFVSSAWGWSARLTLATVALHGIAPSIFLASLLEPISLPLAYTLR